MRCIAVMLVAFGLIVACGGCSFGKTKGSEGYRECMEYLEQLDKTMDTLVDITEKYETNPQKYMNDYTRYLSEYTELVDKWEVVFDGAIEEMSMSERMKVLSEYARIIAKFAG